VTWKGGITSTKVSAYNLQAVVSRSEAIDDISNAAPGLDHDMIPRLVLWETVGRLFADTLSYMRYWAGT